MLKYLALFVVIFGLAVYVSVQDECATQQSIQTSAQLANGTASAKAGEKQPQENLPDIGRFKRICFSFFRWPNGTTAWAIILTLMALVEQTSQTRKAAEATQEAVRDGKKEYILAEDTAKRQLRAYICMDTGEVEIRAGQPIANVHFKNCGQTPAYDVYGWIGVEVRPHPLQSPLPVRDDIAKPKTTVGPGVGFGYPGRRKSKMFTPDELSMIGGPRTTFYVYGRVDYRDAFGSYWYTNVRLIAGGEAGLRVSTSTDGIIRWSLCPDLDGNDAT
jgi:hypothetical protein